MTIAVLAVLFTAAAIDLMERTLHLGAKEHLSHVDMGIDELLTKSFNFSVPEFLGVQKDNQKALSHVTL